MSKTQHKRLKRKAAQAKDRRRRNDKRWSPSKDMLVQMSEQMAMMRALPGKKNKVTFEPRIK